LTRLWPAAIAVTPCAAPLEAQVRVPGSKSLTNRALLLAALAHGLTRLTHALASDDSRHFITALRQLGFNINSSADETTLEVAGCGGELPTARAELFVGNAGTVNTGAIDPLDALADLAAREGLWHHVDGAIGARLMQAIVAILENGQQADGSVEVPEALRPWMMGRDRLVPPAK